MSKITYEALAVSNLKEVLQQVSTACKYLNIDFFLVGAIARNVWLASNNEKATGTKDIDFAVYITNVEEYNSLIQYLSKEYQYKQNTGVKFRLETPKKREIDLLPFGAIEQAKTEILATIGIANLQLDGFTETHKIALSKIDIEGTSYQISSIPAIVILKLIAYQDRPEQRAKDVKDINTICKHYPNFETELIWEQYNHLYENDRSHQKVAMIALGMEMKKILSDNPNLHQRVVRFLQSIIRQENSFLKLMIENSEEETIEMKKQLLEGLVLGVK